MATDAHEGPHLIDDPGRDGGGYRHGTAVHGAHSLRELDSADVLDDVAVSACRDTPSNEIDL